MEIKQLYTNCLAEAAYYIECCEEAAIIDPIRDIEQYIQLAQERGKKIKYIFETHFHADFVSGHIDLAARTGAQIIYGPNANTNYKVYNAKDGEEFKVGKIKIKALHTPGHTLESTSYLLIDKEGKDNAIFTGDTLFVGDVGRPDLLDGSGITKEFLAEKMYESLNSKIKPLADDVIVYPAHGPGSACGKNIGKETWSTIGQQKKSNYYLIEMDKQKFIETLTTGITPPPKYFFEDARINKEGYSNIDSIVERNKKPLSLADFEKEITDGALILDTRNADDFEKGFIPGSINIGLNGQYANWIGTLIHIEQPLVLICDAGKEEESIVRAARVGYENFKGFLSGGINSWINAGKKSEQIKSITPEQFAADVRSNSFTTLDVRKESEFENGHVKNALLFPLGDVNANISALDKSKQYVIHCAGGYRSMIAASLLKAKGVTNVVNVYGGYSKIKDTGVEIEMPVSKT
ncbi:MAG: MBL fold metallo-hydrolase [Bacteroidetes bacterium]|nr:MBL fold metallo-hydrolase [Bacteroidota bacterium]